MSKYCGGIQTIETFYLSEWFIVSAFILLYLEILVFIGGWVLSDSVYIFSQPVFEDLLDIYILIHTLNVKQIKMSHFNPFKGISSL